MASVKVAVRVRPFNQREKDLDAKLIIEMEGKKTRIVNTKAPAGREGDARERHKDFTFDYSYWSFNSSDSHFASQEQVFCDLGTDVVESAFEGYNACVFAYGQTGSGKTFTMMGSPDNQGLIPRICKMMFTRMSMGKEQGASYRTEVSYLEIYNERVKDLLRSNASHVLRVREHPRQGPYVQDLSRHLVMDYADIHELMTRGSAHRTTAATNMNDVSSRSHAIFTIMFVQAGFDNDMPSETKSKVHLVDLAGSERADTSGATGQRLKEGAHINKSLVTLGSVISALAENSAASSEGKQTRSVFIPYRDSVLTWLLKDSLGGNSKTIMLAAISPADCNYGETMSTLRYANRAKNIINKPTINEDPNVRLIRELREEISKLKALLGTGFDGGDAKMLAQLQLKQAQEKELREEWAEKWRETQQILREQQALGLRKSGLGVVLDSDRPHLIGIDDDVCSTGVTLYHLQEGKTRLGSDPGADIMLSGAGLEPEHCHIELSAGVATLVPCSPAQSWVNGTLVDRPTRLSQGCILLLGRTNMFRYNDPAEAAKLRKEGSQTQLNLSRLSLLSWSSPDLDWSAENLTVSSFPFRSLVRRRRRTRFVPRAQYLHACFSLKLKRCIEDVDQADELEMQRMTLQKEKEAFKREQEERKQDWERQQEEKHQALEAAQRQLEEERQLLEQQYAAQCQRLADDWHRLEQQQQDGLASLQSREEELRRRREVLEGERMRQQTEVDRECGQVAALQAQLEERRRQLQWWQHPKSSSTPVKNKAEEGPGPNISSPISADDSVECETVLQGCEGCDKREEIEDAVSEHHKTESHVTNSVVLENTLPEVGRESSPESWASLETSGAGVEAMRELASSHRQELAALEAELRSRAKALAERRRTLDQIDLQLVDISMLLQAGSAEFEAMKKSLAQRPHEEIQEINRRKQSLSLDLKPAVARGLGLNLPLDEETESEESVTTTSESPRPSGHGSEGDTSHTPSSSQDTAETFHTAGSEMPAGVVKAAVASVPSQPAQPPPCEPAAQTTGPQESFAPSETSATQIPATQVPLTDSASTQPKSASSAPPVEEVEQAEEAEEGDCSSAGSYKKALSEVTSGCHSGHSSSSFEPATPPPEASAEQSRSSRRARHQNKVQVRRKFVLPMESRNLTVGEAMREMQDLCQRVAQHKLSIMRCLDHDCDRSQLNKQIAELQELQRQYVRLELILEQAQLSGSSEDSDDISTSADDGLSDLLGDSLRLEGMDLIEGSPARRLSLNLHQRLLQGRLRSPVSPILYTSSCGHNSESRSNSVGPCDSWVHIPSYVLRGSGYSAHFEYELRLNMGGERWTLMRRYRRFRELHLNMCSKYGCKVSSIPFPPRKFFAKTSESVARQRRRLLEAYLRQLFATCITLENCPLFACRDNPSRLALLEFSAFFRKGTFENSKLGPS